MPDTNGHKPASFLAEALAEEQRQRTDPASKTKGNAPNWGQAVLPHVLTFQGIVTSAARVYRASDEAINHSLENARFMRNDCGIMECLEARQRATALLDWGLEPEDETSQEQKDLCEALERILRRMKQFVEYRRVLLEALWFGRYGIQHTYNWTRIGGKMRCLPWPTYHEEQESYGWLPVNGDKLVFRYNDGTVSSSARPGQVGIRVGGRWSAGDKISNKWTVEATDRGLAYFLDPWERNLLAIHKHQIEDGAWEDPQGAGGIHGVGIRSRIYWDWFQKQESLAFLMEYLERSAGGIELWYYPQGNKQAKDETETAAKERIGNQRNIITVPMPIGEDGNGYGVQIIEPGMAGIESLKDILQTYYGHRIKRYILGQILTSEAEATGMGSGLAEMHMDSFMMIVRYDATKLEETITDQLVTPIKNFNYPKASGLHIRFRIKTDAPDLEKKLEAYQRAWEMGAKLRERDVMDAIGASMPADDDRVLQNPAAMPQQPEPPAGQDGSRSKAIAVNGAPSKQELTEQVMRELFGDPDRSAGQRVTYVAEGGKWVERELPSAEHDTGERIPVDRFSRAGVNNNSGNPVSRYSQFNEEQHPRDSEGRFMKGFRISKQPMTDADLHDNHISRLWVDGSDSDVAKRRGVSAMPSLDALVNYFTGETGTSPGRGAYFEGAHLIEFEGDETGDSGWDPGEILLHPRRVVSSTPIDKTDFIERLTDSINERWGTSDYEYVYSPERDEFVERKKRQKGSEDLSSAAVEALEYSSLTAEKIKEILSTGESHQNWDSIEELESMFPDELAELKSKLQG